MKKPTKSILNIIIPLIAVTLLIVGIPIILEFFGFGVLPSVRWINSWISKLTQQKCTTV